MTVFHLLSADVVSERQSCLQHVNAGSDVCYKPYYHVAFLNVYMLNASRYRTHFRPMYKISYKTVTELEWRCCPGYQGHDCMEVKDMRLLQAERLPHAPSASGQGEYVELN